MAAARGCSTWLHLRVQKKTQDQEEQPRGCCRFAGPCQERELAKAAEKAPHLALAFCWYTGSAVCELFQADFDPEFAPPVLAFALIPRGYCRIG